MSSQLPAFNMVRRYRVVYPWPLGLGGWGRVTSGRGVGDGTSCSVWVLRGGWVGRMGVVGWGGSVCRFPCTIVLWEGCNPHTVLPPMLARCQLGWSVFVIVCMLVTWPGLSRCVPAGCLLLMMVVECSPCWVWVTCRCSCWHQWVMWVQGMWV